MNRGGPRQQKDVDQVEFANFQQLLRDKTRAYSSDRSEISLVDAL